MQRLPRLAKGMCRLNMLSSFFDNLLCNSASGDQGVLLRISFFATPKLGYFVIGFRPPLPLILLLTIRYYFADLRKLYFLAGMLQITLFACFLLRLLRQFISSNTK